MLKEFSPVSEDSHDGNSPEGWAAAFAAIRPLTDRRANAFQREDRWRVVDRHIKPGARVLDVGCGIGDWTTTLRRTGRNVVGLDYSREMVATLQRTYPDGEWVEGDARRRLSFADEAFDAIVSWGVIEHDEAGPVAALKEFRRILTVGGRVIVTVPFHNRLTERASAYCGQWLARKHGGKPMFFQYYMTDADLRNFLAEAGLHVLETARLGPPMLGMGLPRVYHATKHRRITTAVLHRAFAGAFAWTDRYHFMLCAVAERRD